MHVFTTPAAVAASTTRQRQVVSDFKISHGRQDGSSEVVPRSTASLVPPAPSDLHLVEPPQSNASAAAVSGQLDSIGRNSGSIGRMYGSIGRSQGSIGRRGKNGRNEPSTPAGPIVAWHALPSEEIFRLLETSPQGLSESEAQQRRDVIFGPNIMTPPQQVSFLSRVWAQINNVLIWILLLATVVCGVLQQYVEVALILGVVVINVSIGLVQEGKATAAAAALKAMLAPQCCVVRDGARKLVDAAELVPGDIVFLQSGDRVPADLRLFDVTKLQVLEAMLTGESHPIAKDTKAVPPAAPLGDRKCLAYSATLVMSGQALGIVVETGDFAEIGKINSLVSGVESGKTNLTVQLEIFGRWISAMVAVIAASTMLLATLGRGFGASDAFTAAVAVAVAIIPAGLPTVVTVVFAIGTQSMARQKAIIKSLPAVETLGSVTVICSDKTGTLTKNEMTAVTLRTADRLYRVTGTGYIPKGKVQVEGEDGKLVDCSEQAVQALVSMVSCGALCSDADIRPPADPADSSSPWAPVGDPTEVALITLCAKLGVDAKEERARAPRLAAVPFESEHKFMATVHKGQQEDSVVYVKGAPDRLIPLCTHQVSGDGEGDGLASVPIEKAFWLQQAKVLSSQGLRVLALCRGALPEHIDVSEQLSASFLAKGGVPLNLLCLVAIMDPPRDEAAAAIKEAHQAGIVVKMITGDHRDTALAIGRMLGIAQEGDSAYTGPELDGMADSQLDEVVLKCNVFARASPENKIRIVKSLQRLRQVSSMTGDGVNDAPALRAANIGVAMGITGTDVSKEAAKMVLADDNFATIVVAVKEGRRVWDNLVKIILYNTPVSIAQGMSTFFAYALDMPEHPLTVYTILYTNMITSVAMGMAYAFEPAEPGVMQRPPRRAGAQLFSTEVLWRNVFVGGIMLVAILGTFELALMQGSTLREARAEAFTQLIMAEVAYLFNCRFLRSTSMQPGALLGNPWILVSVAITVGLQVFLVYTPAVNTFFDCEPMSGSSWGRVIGFSALIFLAVEVEKQALHYIRPALSARLTWLARFMPSTLRVPGHHVPSTSALHVSAPGAPSVDAAGPVVQIAVDDPVAGAGESVAALGGRRLSTSSVDSYVDLSQAELDSVRFFATSASSFGIPMQSHVPGRPGEAAHRMKAMSTADLFAASAMLQAHHTMEEVPPGTVPSTKPSPLPTVPEEGGAEGGGRRLKLALTLTSVGHTLQHITEDMVAHPVNDMQQLDAALAYRPKSFRIPPGGTPLVGRSPVPAPSPSPPPSVREVFAPLAATAAAAQASTEPGVAAKAVVEAEMETVVVVLPEEERQVVGEGAEETQASEEGGQGGGQAVTATVPNWQ